MDYEPVIGLEIHAQLLTTTKIFCGCSTVVESPANTHVCPVCLGLPGALPVLNREAVDQAIKAGLALNCTIQPRSIFARKNYFYPDLPKGYQISQYEQPLATDGYLEFTTGGVTTRVGIIRVHMEEDAGKSLHEGFPDSQRKTYLDFNRSGVPLIEIVTRPDLRSAADAAEFFRRLREILVAISVNDGNMEEGSLRCDANVSVRPAGSQALGVKAEVKNLNSFRFLEQALEYELQRQVGIAGRGGRVTQETRLWDSDAHQTVSMRSKEEAHDYRYFPDPDLPALVVTEARIQGLRAQLPELPAARRQRLMTAYSLSEREVSALESTDLVAYFEQTARATGQPRAAFNWVSGAVAHKKKTLGAEFDPGRVPGDALAGLIALVDQGRISNSVAKDVFERMYESGRTAEDLVRAEGLAQIDDRGALLAAIRGVLERHADAVEQYRAGKSNALGFLVGQVMKTTGGKANPRLVNELLKAELDTTTIG
jgi:aspartyl-tRNA(Asn)/glutamyl-tRNA(Gln) amidotransferase subunit B